MKEVVKHEDKNKAEQTDEEDCLGILHPAVSVKPIRAIVGIGYKLGAYKVYQIRHRRIYYPSLGIDRRSLSCVSDRVEEIHKQISAAREEDVNESGAAVKCVKNGVKGKAQRHHPHKNVGGRAFFSYRAYCFFTSVKHNIS